MPPGPEEKIMSDIPVAKDPARQPRPPKKITARLLKLRLLLDQALPGVLTETHQYRPEKHIQNYSPAEKELIEIFRQHDYKSARIEHVLNNVRRKKQINAALACIHFREYLQKMTSPLKLDDAVDELSILTTNGDYADELATIRNIREINQTRKPPLKIEISRVLFNEVFHILARQFWPENPITYISDPRIHGIIFLLAESATPKKIKDLILSWKRL